MQRSCHFLFAFLPGIWCMCQPNLPTSNGDMLELILGQLRVVADGQKYLVDGQKSLDAKLNSLEREVQDRLPEYILTKSPALLGLEQRKFVLANNLYRIFIPTNSAAVLTDAENTALKSMSEKALQEFICGKLQNLVKNRVVVRSDTNQWLETASKHSKTKLKPDVFIINRAFLKEIGESGQVLQGIPAHRSLYLGTDLVDFKKINGSDAFGELVNHLQHLEANIVAFTKESTNAVKGALAHNDGIELVILSRGNVVYLESILWTAGGSAARLSDFFEVEKNPIALALNDILEISKLKLYDNNNCKARFLGVGGTGSVFWVDRSQSVRRGMALKVAAGTNNVVRLKYEFRNNQMVAERAADVIVKAIELFHSRKSEAAGLLMEEVGREVAATELDKALEALASLHKAGFRHGDARRQNLLFCSKILKWCDLQCTEDISELENEVKTEEIYQDISTLLHSFGKELDNPLDKDLLEKYIADVSKVNLEALVAKSLAIQC